MRTCGKMKKGQNIHIMGVIEKEKKDYRAEKVFEEIMAERFPKAKMLTLVDCDKLLIYNVIIRATTKKIYTKNILKTCID